MSFSASPDFDQADFAQWVTKTCQLLRDRRWQEIDVPQLIGELEDLGK